MRKFTDKQMLDWIEQQSNGTGWTARQSTTGRGFRLHNRGPYEVNTYAKPTAREAIAHAMNKELDGMSKL